MAPSQTQVSIRLTEPVIFLLGGQEHERARARRRRAARTTTANGVGEPPIGGGSRNTSPAPPPSESRGRTEVFVPPGPIRASRSRDRGRSPAGTLQAAAAREQSRSQSRVREIVEGTTTGSGTAEEAEAADEPPPAMLRGLLTLTLAKPSRIRDITVKFRGLARTEWPEGIGPRRLDTMEENVLTALTYTFFSASNLSNERRAASIGPGFREDNASDNTLDARGRSARRSSSMMPTRDTSVGLAYRSRDSAIHRFDNDNDNEQNDGRGAHGAASRAALSRIASSTNLEDHTFAHIDSDIPPITPGEPSPAYELVPSYPSSPLTSIVDLTPFPYDLLEPVHTRRSPSLPNRSHFERSPTPSRSPLGPALRDPLIQGLNTTSRRSTLSHEEPTSPPDSPGLSSRPSLLRGEPSAGSTSESTLSPATSFVDTSDPEVGDPGWRSAPVPGSTRSSFERGRPRSREASETHSNGTVSSSPAAASSSPSALPLQSTRTRDSSRGTQAPNGIGPPTFQSFGSQRSPTSIASTERASIFRTTSRNSTSSVPPPSRSARLAASKSTSRFSLSGLTDALRGKSATRSISKDTSSEKRAESPDTRRGDFTRDQSRGRKTAMKALKHSLATDTGAVDEESDDEEDGDKGKGRARGWKEFRAGTYTYPISIPIPASLPPTITAEFGHVVYSLKATIHRAGALTTNLTASTDVVLVSCPGQDDTEESESIVVERFWETQMKYHIALSGKSFPIGASIPISIRLNPLAKIKLYRITAILEQKTSYFAANRKLTRHEPPKKFPLLRIENTDPKEPLLPILSDDPDAIKNHPLAQWFINPTSSDDTTPSCLDPIGPWHLESTIKLPDCASRVTFSTIHDKANTNVSHILKIMLRVERGDDDFLDSKGKRKLWDVIIETPIHILSCRCTQTLLPAYSSSTTMPSLSGSSMSSMAVSANFGNYDCGWNHTTNTPTRAPPQGAVASLVGGRSASANQAPPIATLAQNLQFARLVAGEETPAGDVPPPYDAVLAGALSAGTLAPVERSSSAHSDATTRGRGRANSSIESLERGRSSSIVRTRG